MPIHPQDNILIEKHLLERLTPEEKAAFEARLNDPDFQKELELQKDLAVAFKSSGRDQLKDELQGFEKKIQEKSVATATPARFQIGRALAMAATLALLIIAGYFIMNQGASKDQLFADYFEPYPNVVNPIDKNSGPTDRQGEAFRTYERGNYQEAIDNFSRLNTKGDAVYLYQGISELALGNTENALTSLDKVIIENGAYFIPAQWYKALCFIKSGRSSEAVPLLEQVEQKAGTEALKNQAAQLLEELK